LCAASSDGEIAPSFGEGSRWNQRQRNRDRPARGTVFRHGTVGFEDGGASEAALGARPPADDGIRMNAHHRRIDTAKLVQHDALSERETSFGDGYDAIAHLRAARDRHEAEARPVS